MSGLQEFAMRQESDGSFGKAFVLGSRAARKSGKEINWFLLRGDTRSVRSDFVEASSTPSLWIRLRCDTRSVRGDSVEGPACNLEKRCELR